MKTLIFRAVLVISLITLGAGSSWSQNAEQLYQKGIMKEEGEGSLREAIELYKSVADNTLAERALRAKALYQMGNCYEKLGQQEARGVYEKLVANYGDQPELVANAKKKLTKLSLNGTVITREGITINQLNFDGHAPFIPSPDGNYVGLFDWSNFPTAEILDSKTGRKWKISDRGDYTKYPMPYPTGTILFSPDGKQAAYGWVIENMEGEKFIGKAEIHLVNMDGSNNRIIANDDIFFDIKDWSVDGNYLLCAKNTNLKFRTDENEKNELYIVSLKDGSRKQVIDFGNRKIEKASFTNDGKHIVFNAQAEFKAENYDIYSVPVSGGEITTLISNKEYDSEPFRVPGTNQMVFFSSHSGVNELWEMALHEGKLQKEPEVMKSNFDISSVIHGIKTDGTIYFSTKRLSPADIYTAKLYPEKKELQLSALDVKRNPGLPVRRVLFSPSMKKVACFLQGGKVAADQAVKTKLNWVIKDLETGKETEIKNDLRFNLENVWYGSGWWSFDEKSILIRGWDMDDVAGLYQINVKSGEYKLISKWSDLPGVLTSIMHSPEGETGYYMYDLEKGDGSKIIAVNSKTGEGKTIKEFDHQASSTYLSPDGNKMVYSNDLGINYLNIDGSNETVTLSEPGKKAGWPIGWSLDSQNVFVKKYNEEKKGYEIWSLSVKDKTLELMYNTEQLKDFRYARTTNIQPVQKSTYLTMTMGSYLDEMWEMKNVFSQNLGKL